MLEDRKAIRQSSGIQKKSMPGYYQGRPEPGSRHVFAIPLPPVANFAQILDLQLRDGNVRIPQDDLNASLDLSFPDLPRVAAPTPSPPAAAN